MTRNSEIVELKATSSKSLMRKLQTFEVNRQKLVKERENYGMPEMSSPNKEADFPKEGDFANKRRQKHVSRLATVDCHRGLTATQRNLKELDVVNEGMNRPVTRLEAVEHQREFPATQSKQKAVEVATKRVNKSVPRLDEIDNQRDLTNTQCKLKEGDVATKRMKKYEPKKLDFSHLQSTFDRISNKNKTMPGSLDEQQSTPTQQPEKLETNYLAQGERAAQGLNNSSITERDASDGLKRKLGAIQKLNNTMPVTNLVQQPSSINSAHMTRNQGQQNNSQVNCEMIQERQDELLLSSSERDAPQAEEGILLEQGGSRSGKSKAILRATTIDEFLKENGINVELEGLTHDGLSTKPHSDEGDSLALDKDYSPHVMADIVDEGDTRKKKKTCGNTTCSDIYSRTMEQREKVFFYMGQPVGPTSQSVSNLTSFLGTLGRNKRVTKFILPADTKKWVIQSVRDAWKRFKGKINQKHFLPYDNVDEMVKNRPLQVPPSEFIS